MVLELTYQRSKRRPSRVREMLSEKLNLKGCSEMNQERSQEDIRGNSQYERSV